MNHPRIRQLIVAAFAAVFTAACPAGEPVARLRLKPQVTVRTRKLTLGQIVQVHSSDADLAKTMRDISLGNAPSPGHVRLVGADTIRIRLLYAGIDPSLVTFDGRFVKVRTEARKIASKELVDMAIDYAMKLLPYPPQDLDITLVRTPQDRVVPLGDQAIEFKVSQLGKGRPWGKTQFIVRAMAGNTVLFRAPVYLDIRVFGKVAIALTDIARGETFTHQNVGLKRADLTDASSSLNSVDPFIGQKASRPVRSFSRLNVRMIARSGPVMKRGDIVTMLLEKGGLRVIAQAQVVEDGHLGQTVRVRNLTSKRQAYGKVIDPRTVRIVF